MKKKLPMGLARIAYLDKNNNNIDTRALYVAEDSDNIKSLIYGVQMDMLLLEDIIWLYSIQRLKYIITKIY